jgi:hypothetical protein
MGGSAGDAITTGDSNTAIGHEALGAEDSGNKNTAVGAYAMQDLNYNGDGFNTAVGYVAGKEFTTAVKNTAIGSGALSANKTANKNVAVGYNALDAVDPLGSVDTHNVAVGHEAGLVSTGTDNVLVGSGAGSSMLISNNNTCIGRAAGDLLTTGNNNVIIGAGSDASAVGVNNEVNLWNGSVVARFQGAAAAWSFVSDERDKKEIEDLELGVDFVNKLKPRKFKWDLRNSDVDKDKEASGFIAQEVKEVIDEVDADYTRLVDTNNPDQYTLAQSNLIPVLVKAVQELSAEVKQLKQQLNN